MSKPKMIAVRITFSSEEKVPPVVRQFTERLDEVEPGTPSKKWAPGDSVKVYPGPLEGQSLDDYLAKMEATHDLVLAYYEAKTDPKDAEKKYHNVPYFFMEKSVAKCHPRFAPRRPAILAELRALTAGNTLRLRAFYDNAQLTSDGQKDGDWRRWELSLNGVQAVVPGRAKMQLQFRGAQ
ncbi:MAG: hypothetical protein Q7S10_01605 [bacterium]|nr:hypothetical protein [bacterium]